jgi:hypothetical protein
VPNCIHVIHHFSVKIRMRLVTEFPSGVAGQIGIAAPIFTGQ